MKANKCSSLQSMREHDGYIILMRYYNSKNPYSNLHKWHAYVGRSPTTCNNIETLVHDTWSSLWEMSFHTFVYKKDAEAYLKKVKKSVEATDPKSFNLCKDYQPDRFHYKISKVHLTIEADFEENVE